MDKKQIFQIIEEKTGMKKWVIILALTALGLALLGFGGSKGWNMYGDHLDALEKEKQADIELAESNRLKSIDSMACIQQEREEEYVNIDMIKNNIPNYKYKFNKAEDEITKLKDSIRSIYSSQFTKRELDSFADNARVQR